MHRCVKHDLLGSNYWFQDKWVDLKPACNGSLRKREMFFLSLHINVALSGLPAFLVHFCRFPYLFPNSFGLGKRILCSCPAMFHKPQHILAWCCSTHTDSGGRNTPLTSWPYWQTHGLSTDGRQRRTARGRKYKHQLTSEVTCDG